MLSSPQWFYIVVDIEEIGRRVLVVTLCVGGLAFDCANAPAS